MRRPMKKASRLLFALLPVLFLWTAACASSGTMEQNGAPEVTVQVNNNLTVPTALTVTLLQAHGTNNLLGTVEPGRDESFPVRQAIAAGSYQLSARTTEGNVLQSEPFTLTGDAMVTWNVNQNTVRVEPVNSE